MRALGSVLAVCLVFVLLGESRRAESQNADKLIGTWTVVKEDGKDPKGDVTVTFMKDGKLAIALKFGDKEFKADGTYKLDGNKLTTTIKFGGKEKTEVQAVQTLNETTLITKDSKDKVTEFKKK
jgi:uncharacterized protein (TIGR03066 family)